MKHILTLTVLAAALLSACSKNDADVDPTLAVQIDPTIADPALFPKATTRVTDTDFETGDKICVTITMADDNSQFLNNKEFKFDGTNFTAPGTLWYEDANLKSSIFAYHPYQTGTAIPTEFSVLGDQNGDNYQKSDLIIGTKTGVKPDRTIGMTFKHKMTRIIIRVTNGTDTDVTEILIKGAIGTGTIDAKTGEFTAKEGGATLDVKACERTKNQLYYALFVPQKGVKLETSVTTSDNKTRSYTLGTTDLTSGTNRELKMNVMPKDLEIILGGQIDNWTDGSELEIETGGSVQEPETPTVSWGGVDYKTVTLKDGRTWMAENLRYVPEGKTPSSDPAEEAGIWYPAANADKTAAPELAKKVGLLYDAATAFGVAEITPENAESFEGVRGICPDGWHIPTNAELTGLVGYNANGSLKDENAPYYDNGGNQNLPLLDGAGFNWCFAGARNKANVTATGSYLVTSYGDVYGAMTYVWGSTCYKVIYKTGDPTTLQNIQFYSFMSTLNASNNKVSVAYGNFKSGYPVRCIKDKETVK